jgi:diadenosine tetraphosphate (Ap4A) HIT family hydrolase
MSTGIEGLTVVNPWQPPEQLALQHCMTIPQGHANALQDALQAAIQAAMQLLAVLERFKSENSL